jgi:putative membrane protein
MEYVLVKYLHLLGVFVLFSTLVIEHVLVKPEMSNADLKKILAIDLIYGLSVLVVLTAGLSLWFLVGKPSGFYSSNPVFHIKVGLFLLIGLLSIYPTAFFLKNRKSSASVIAVPKAVVMFIRVELLFLVLIPLLAVLMAQGYGLS